MSDQKHEMKANLLDLLRQPELLPEWSDGPVATPWEVHALTRAARRTSEDECRSHLRHGR